MTEEEIKKEVTEREYVDEDRRIYREFVSPQKLAAFLAKHLCP